ncbi:UNVERIFIED_CONTAM: Ethylene-responsive transcription factor WRI1 [Sesamum latifolium]|uniref:Ethylene-responsive transcription factor WRI1 n=1 Tax=Sesamum latifolium TaxID=2727402 RepID=A0AAW2Y7A7_9LAMI
MKSCAHFMVLSSGFCNGNGRQSILNSSGAYDDEEAAARAYDLAALKYWGTSTSTNFPISDYEKEIEVMETITKEEYLASLRRNSSGFSRGVSKYRGVARHHHNGRWEARIGRVFGNKYLYLGTYSTQEEAARAYDIAAIEYRGMNAITNFDLSNYIRWLKPGANISVPSQEAEPETEMQKALAVVNRSKQELHRRNVLFGLCRKPSSPTALGLLLRSSMYKELVEKNSVLRPEQENSNGEYGGCGMILPFVLSSNSNMGLSCNLQGQLHSRHDCPNIKLDPIAILLHVLFRFTHT